MKKPEMKERLVIEGKKERSQSGKSQAKGSPRLLQNQEYLSVREAAKLLGVSERSAYGYIASGKLPGERIGQSIVVRRETLDAYQRPAVGRPRTHTPIWRIPVEVNLQYISPVNQRALVSRTGTVLQAETG